jgi:hypothetical protein
MTEPSVREMRDELEDLGQRYLELLRQELRGLHPHVARELTENTARRAALRQAIAEVTRASPGPP